MIATKQLPVEVLQELANEFAAGLPARAAVMREAIDEIERGAANDAAQRLYARHGFEPASITLRAIL